MLDRALDALLDQIEKRRFGKATRPRAAKASFLELDHVVPVALGGDASDGVRVLCRSHNRFEAERILGRATVEAGDASRDGSARCREARVEWSSS